MMVSAVVFDADETVVDLRPAVDGALPARIRSLAELPSLLTAS